MKYFFISDIHGQYEMMLAALQQTGFDMEKDTLVSVGDPFDRGPKSKEVLDFILQCPNRIIILGNHDWRLKVLLWKPVMMNKYDISNGVPATIKSFLNIAQDNKNYGMNLWTALDKLNDIKELKQYFAEGCYAIEFKNLIATHGWLPHEEIHYTLDPNWRKADKQAWYDATWAHTEKCIIGEAFPDKKLLVGHWHAWRIAELYGEKRYKFGDQDSNPSLNADIFETDKLITIDGCTNYPFGGKVNVYVYESDEAPIYYG